MDIFTIDTFILKSLKSIPKKIYITFIATFLFGFIIHLFMFTNKLPNHDDITLMYSSIDMYNVGRWFLWVPCSISARISMPWVIGLLSISYISIAACFVISCLKIKKNIHCILVGLLMVSFPTISDTFSYMATADGYFFGLMLACMSAYFAFKGKYGIVLSTIFMVLSLGIYQAYLCTAAVLMVAGLIVRIIRADLTNRKIFFSIIKMIIGALIALAIYLVIFKITVVEPTSYMGIDSMGKLSITTLPSLILRSYKEIFSFFLFDSFSFHGKPISIAFILFGLLSVISIALVVIKGKLYRNYFTLFCLTFLLLILPLAASMIYIMSPVEDPHILMLYSYAVFLVALLGLFEASISSFSYPLPKLPVVFFTIASWSIAGIFLLASYNYSIIANKEYTKLFLTYEQGFAYSNRLIMRLESFKDYSKDSVIYLLGTPQDSNQQVMPFQKKLSGIVGIRVDIPRMPRYYEFLDQYMGFKNQIISIRGSKISELSFAEAVYAMPNYPAEGSIRQIEDVIVVRFSD